MSLVVNVFLCCRGWFKFHNYWGDFEKAHKPKPGNMLANFVKVGNNRMIIKTAKEVLAKDPGNFEAHYYLGVLMIMKNKPELALIEYKAADKIGIFTRNINEYDLVIA